MQHKYIHVIFVISSHMCFMTNNTIWTFDYFSSWHMTLGLSNGIKGKPPRLLIIGFALKCKFKACSLTLTKKKCGSLWDETIKSLLKWTQGEANLHKSRKNVKLIQIGTKFMHGWTTRKQKFMKRIMPKIGKNHHFLPCTILCTL